MYTKILSNRHFFEKLQKYMQNENLKLFSIRSNKKYFSLNLCSGGKKKYFSVFF